MRELKLRFINTGDGTVYKPITLKELCLRMEIPRRIILESENGDFVDTDDFLDLLEKDELIIEQYTGLKDKNVKEIYEGDIVQDGKGEKCRVEWTESEAHFGLYVGRQMELTDFIWMRGEDLEVIGNVHENPELLDGDKPKSNWTDITHDDEAMERVSKGVAEMQKDVLKKAEKIRKELENEPQQHEEDYLTSHS